MLTIEISSFNRMSRKRCFAQYTVTDYEQTYAGNVMLGSTSPPSKIKGGQSKSPTFIFAEKPPLNAGFLVDSFFFSQYTRQRVFIVRFLPYGEALPLSRKGYCIWRVRVLDLCAIPDTKLICLADKLLRSFLCRAHLQCSESLCLIE